jgi:hypothetical protein
MIVDQWFLMLIDDRQSMILDVDWWLIIWLKIDDGWIGDQWPVMLINNYWLMIFDVD